MTQSKCALGMKCVWYNTRCFFFFFPCISQKPWSRIILVCFLPSDLCGFGMEPRRGQSLGFKSFTGQSALISLICFSYSHNKIHLRAIQWVSHPRNQPDKNHLAVIVPPAGCVSLWLPHSPQRCLNPSIVGSGERGKTLLPLQSTPLPLGLPW